MGRRDSQGLSGGIVPSSCEYVPVSRVLSRVFKVDAFHRCLHLHQEIVETLVFQARGGPLRLGAQHIYNIAYTGVRVWET